MSTLLSCPISRPLRPGRRLPPAAGGVRRPRGSRRRQPARVAAMLSLTFPLSAWETGHPSFALSAAFRKPSASSPGTQPRTVSALETIRKPASTLSKVTAALTSSFCGGFPALASPKDSAIAKQPAWAAAISSSGLVFPTVASLRAAHEIGTAVNARLVAALTAPLPFNSSPSQVTSARLGAGTAELLGGPWEGTDRLPAYHN